MGELKPCPNPWCNSHGSFGERDGRSPAIRHEAGVGHSHYVECLFCCVQTPNFASPDEAILAWNTRPRTEGRGDQEPVASDKALFDALWELVAAMANEGIPQTPRTKAAFKVAHQAALDRLRKDWSSPIREPEISRPDRELAAREAFQVLYPHENWNDLDERYDVRGGYHPMQIKAFEVADAILNLAPVGGRGEEGSSQSQPVLSPKSDNQWLVWSGDDQPVEDGVLVDVRFNRRCGGYGKEANGYPADFWDWSHDGTADPVIIEWRISPSEISADDGASSRHTGQLRDEPSSSNHNEESQTNGS